MILVDSWKVNYQTLPTTCQKLIIKIAKNAWKEKKLDQNMNLLLWLKDNKLNYKCKESNETSAKSVNDLIENVSKNIQILRC